jgi:CHAD domain-containing protein
VTRSARVSSERPGRHLSVVAAAPVSPAVRAVADYLNRAIDDVLAGDAALRDGDDPIGDIGLAMRRFRSTVRVFGEVFDRAAVDHIDGELRWFSGQLGVVRDCQVQRRRMVAALAALPDTLVLGSVASDIRNHLASVELPARARIDEALDSPRYLAMLAVLRWWRVEPILTLEPSTDDLAGMARTARRTADRRLATALEAADPTLLHSARKAAKRARYAAELLTAVDDTARRKAKRYKRIQRLLGDHRDSIVAAELLRRLGASIGSEAAHNGFTYGLLYEREQRAAADRLCALRKLV